MQLLRINNHDYTPYLALNGLHVAPQVLLSSKSGRNARGNNVIDIVNRKDKLLCEFLPMPEAVFRQFWEDIEPYVVQITFLHPGTGEEKTITANVGEQDYAVLLTTVSPLQLRERLYTAGFSLNFIEL